MIECIPAPLGRLDENAQVRTCLLLADEFGERLRADSRLEGVRLALGRAEDPVGHGLFVARFAAPVKHATRDREALSRSKAKSRTNGGSRDTSATVSAVRLQARGVFPAAFGAADAALDSPFATFAKALVDALASSAEMG